MSSIEWTKSRFASPDSLRGEGASGIYYRIERSARGFEVKAYKSGTVMFSGRVSTLISAKGLAEAYEDLTLGVN